MAQLENKERDEAEMPKPMAAAAERQRQLTTMAIPVSLPADWRTICSLPRNYATSTTATRQSTSLAFSCLIGSVSESHSILPCTLSFLPFN